MTAVTDATAMINMFAGKTLDNPTLLRVVDRVIATQGNKFFNPWDVEVNPTEFAAWPTNEEKAAFFIDVGESYYRSLLYRAGVAEEKANSTAAESDAGTAAANEI